MANRVTIDVEARFVDRVTVGMNTAAKSADKLERSMKNVNKELDKTARKNVKPKLGADDNAFTKKIRAAQSKADKLGKTKVSATLGAIDKASAKIGQATGAARAFASKVFRSSLAMKDNASGVIGDVTSAARSFAGKTFSAAVKIVDYATTPLRKIKESLFSIKTLIGVITTGFAAKQFLMDPISLADQYSSAKIGFSTLLGETEGQAMMNEIDAFAKATPFKTAGVISNVQKMMAYGWDASRVIQDMETIGDAAAATGKGDEGLTSIVYALSEIRSKGKLSTQELNQLASAGIKAKQYLAQGLGYGTDDKGMARLMEDLEDGAIGANQAIELILKGMEEFDGMMDQTANETVSGLWSQIQDTFEINVFRRWGQGLQDGAKKGFGYIVDLLNSSEGALQDFGDLVYDIGKEISNWSADKLGKLVENIKAVMESSEFKNASLGGKIKILWDRTIMDPLKRWWNSDEVQSWLEEKKEWLRTKAESMGEGLGKGLTSGLLALLGVKTTDAIGEGASIGASFAKGFAEGFDGSAVTKAIVDAIKRVWEMLPTWAKVLVGGYGVGKLTSGIGSVLGGVGSIIGLGGRVAGGIGGVLGSTGNAMVQGTGLLNLLANAGYAVTGSTTMSGGMAALAGFGTIAGTAAGAYGAFDGIRDLYTGFTADRSTELGKRKFDAYTTSGAAKVGGVAAGAAIGTAILPGVGTAIGAGLGYIGGKLLGDWQVEKYEKLAREVEAAKYSSEEMQEAIKDGSYSAEELNEIFKDACWDDMKNRFGDIELSMKEINRLAQDVVYDQDASGMKKFADATKKAEESLQNFQAAAADMERLNFDMNELNWKIEFGIGEKLSEEEIADVKARVKNYVESAEALISDEHYKFNAAVEVLLEPKEGEDNAMYNQIMTSSSSFYVKMQKQLDEQTAELTAKYNLYLEDGIITADEQEILSGIQTKIAEITEKISNAETEASFEVAKLKFTTGEITPESFEQLQSTLQSELENYVAEQDQALTVAISSLNLQLNEGHISEEQYNEQLEALVDGYNSNIESMSARVNSIQLEGISEAFDEVATAEQLQSAINAIVEEGKNPLDITFSDINAHLNLSEDALSEEAKTNFTSVMQSAIQSAVTGDNALTTTADVSATMNMQGTEGIPLSEEALAGKTAVQGAIDTAFGTGFDTTAKANVTLDWNIMNPAISVLMSGAGSGSSTVTATIGENARGGFINEKMLSWVGEEGPEAIIPLVPGRRSRGLQLWAEAGRRLGVQYHANGGIVGGDSGTIKPYEGDIQSNGDNTIEINMGGVTIEIHADGNKSMLENIEEQEQEIAEKVATIFKNVLGAQFANIPVRGNA